MKKICKSIIKTGATVVISILAVTLISYAATTISTNINTGGTLTVSGTTSFGGITYTWPTSDGSASTYLQTDGSGTMSWASVSSGSSSDWTQETNYGALNLTASTTIPYWAKSAIYASSTLQVVGDSTFEAGLTAITSTTTSATTTNLYISGILGGTAATTTMLGGLAIETSGFVYDFSTNYVGIGTAVPAAELDINGTIRTDGSLFQMPSGSTAPATTYTIETQDGIDYINFVTDTDTAGNRRIEIPDIALRLTDSIDVELQFLADESDFWSIGAEGSFSNAFVISNTNNLSGGAQVTILRDGNVGIGTTSPSQVLHVFGTAATTTVEFGDIASSTAKTCFNVNQADGSAGSFYFNASGIVFESNACK